MELNFEIKKDLMNVEIVIKKQKIATVRMKFRLKEKQS